jgi:hypothetical protein
MIRWLIPLVAIGGLGYLVLKGAAPAGSQPQGFTVVALPAGAVKITTIKGVTIYSAAGTYYAQQGTTNLVMPLTGTNIISFVSQLSKAGMI